MYTHAHARKHSLMAKTTTERNSKSISFSKGTQTIPVKNKALRSTTASNFLTFAVNWSVFTLLFVRPYVAVAVSPAALSLFNGTQLNQPTYVQHIHTFIAFFYISRELLLDLVSGGLYRDCFHDNWPSFICMQLYRDLFILFFNVSLSARYMFFMQWLAI